MSDENDFEDDDKYPWEDVEAARKNRRLQRKHSIADGQNSYIAVAKPCPQCGTAAGQLSWFYFDSPPKTWEDLCGRAGWMTVCDGCHVQVNFFMEAMN